MSGSLSHYNVIGPERKSHWLHICFWAPLVGTVIRKMSRRSDDLPSRYGCVKSGKGEDNISDYRRMLTFSLATLFVAISIIVTPVHGQDHGPPKYTSPPDPPARPGTEEQRSELKAVETAAMQATEAGDCKKAAPLHWQAHDLRFEVYQSHTRPAVDSLMRAANCFAKDQDYGTALEVGELVWQGRQWTYGTHAAETRQILEWLISIARKYSEASNAVEALEKVGRYYAEIYAIKWTDIGVLHPRAYKGFVETGIAMFDKGSADHDEAVIGRAMLLLEQALLRNQDLGKHQELNLVARNRFARGLAMRDELEDAEHISYGTVALANALHGANHQQTIRYMLHHAEILSDLGSKAEALTIAKLADEAARAGLEGQHDQRILAHYQHRKLASEVDATPTSLEQLKVAVAAVEEQFGPADSQTLEALSSLAQQHLAMGAAKEANRLDQMVLDRSSEVGNSNPQQTRVFLGKLARSLLHLPGGRHLASDVADRHLMRVQYRHEEISSNPEQIARLNRSHDDIAAASKLMLDALWEKVMHEDGRVSSDNWMVSSALIAAEDVFKAGASSAIAETAARRLVERKRPSLGPLARKRQTLLEQYLALHDATIARIASSDPSKPRAKQNTGPEERRELLRVEIEKINQQFQQEIPEFFYTLIPGPYGYDSTENLLRSDETILLLVPSEFGTHSLLVWKGGMNWHRSSLTEQDIGKNVQRLLWEVGANVDVNPADVAEWLDEAGGKYTFDRSTAHRLYIELIKPHADIINSKGHMFVAADGPLASLPLSILVTEPPVGDDYDPASLRSTAWFSDVIATGYIPSVNAWKSLRSRERRTGTAQQFAGFGDPLLDGKAETRGSGQERRLRSGNYFPSIASLFDRGQSRSANSSAVLTESLRSLARLPGTAMELESIRLALDAPQEAVVMGDAATELAVKSADLSGVDILAFATHGLIAGELRGASEPGLVMTPPAKASGSNDGLLTATEVSRLDLRADWVILSACNTAAGDGTEGAAGFSGLARAFFLAGAGNLLASHWPVRDDVAALLTVRTITMHRENPQLSKSQAFQRAMKEIRDDASADSATDSWAHPNAWAPFVLVGDR